jgi:glutamate synthase (ferredoxin)
MAAAAPSPARGLYDPRYEHDACGVGFVADLSGRATRGTLDKALRVLHNLGHRGATGRDEDCGDGAGVLLQTPHRFLARECDRLGLRLPPGGEYAAGTVFLPREPWDRLRCERLLERAAREEGLHVLGWRTVPIDDRPLGATARACRPAVRQVFVGRGRDTHDEAAFARRLFTLRKRAETLVRAGGLPGRDAFYVASLCPRTVVYKGMLTAASLPLFYPDLLEPEVETALAVVHARFSTNTFPSWSRAHPYRRLAHNGEINTLRGNVNWMRAREGALASRLFGPDLARALPVLEPDGSDSAMLDNALELLTLAGRALPHAVMLLLPEPWAGDGEMSPSRRAFYEFHDGLLEPWDGPAAVVFTDGVRVGAALDRNGLRPGRYCVTADGLVVLASEAGVLDLPPEQVTARGRLEPGRLFLVDLHERRVVPDCELKERVASERPYASWLAEKRLRLDELPPGPPPLEPATQELRTLQQALGYTAEDLKVVLPPMAGEAHEALGSMGDDTPLAVLSERPQLLYSYFRQLFAQVTNPPLDAIREARVVSLDTTLGPSSNLLEPGPEDARQVRLRSPLLSDVDLGRLRNMGHSAGRDGGVTPPRGPAGTAATLRALYPAAEGSPGLEAAVARLCREAEEAIAGGAVVVILSDRGVDDRHVPVPSLLAVSAVHHHLIGAGVRMRAGLVVETAEAREVHHLALLIGYGAGAVNPYLALASCADLAGRGLVAGVTAAQATANYLKAAGHGLLKVMSKMGISTVRSYCGAQVFEAVGLDVEFVARYFPGTPSRVGGIGLDVVDREARARHVRAFGLAGGTALATGGQYQWRRDGELHLFNPQTVHKLQRACRAGDYGAFGEYSRLVDDQSARLYTLRGLFELRPAGDPVPLEEVEPVEALVRRFKTGAMSYGSISQEAHETLAVAMNRLGGKSNTGEGGEDPARYALDANGDSRNSAIKQVASARFGVTSEYLVRARELQIKMAQGAKPGEGGQLPGHKVYPWIARVRHATPGVGLISPPPHHDIYSIEDLAQLIHDLKNANPEARVSVKLVAEVGVGTVAAGVAKARADVILISGHDGGTGASPLTGVKYAGIPWEIGLAEAQQVLAQNGLRDRVVLEADGQLKTGRDVVVAALLGAEEFGFATAPLVALGCLMMRVCHLNTCPVGIATQDPRLRQNFRGEAAQVANFMTFVAREVREWMARLGFRRLDDMVGRADLLSTRAGLEHYKARGLDFSRLFHVPQPAAGWGRRCLRPQDHGLDRTLDRTTLLPLCRPALEEGQPVAASLPVRNTDRVVGTMLGSEITRRYGAAGLPDDTVRLSFRGSAGQSFGAFIPRGLTLVLEGEANDYLGKGLSGGRVVVCQTAGSRLAPPADVVAGNVAFYGGTSGEAFVAGSAGERFAVRNSGIVAVVEGVGDHGCEYMTGGRVVVLGPTGRNFAAGMSGGIAYVLDDSDRFPSRCNRDMVGLFALEDPQEISWLRELVGRHAALTGSPHARGVLAEWDEAVRRFVKVYPNDYRRVVEAQRRFLAEGLGEQEALMAAFEENARDLARAGGQ